jgi:Tol biopolymer transport system component
VAIVKRVAGGRVVELDSSAGPTVLNVTDAGPFFSRDSKRLAYSAVLKEGCATYIVDNKAGDCFSRVGTGLFSPDGSRFAFIGIRGGRSVLVADGVAGKEYGGIAAPVFSNDGRSLAYWAQQPGGWYLIGNGREDGPFEATKTPNPMFSPEGKLIYVGVRGGRTHLIMDGKPLAQSENGFASPVFSPTGKLIVYGLNVMGGANLLIDGLPIGSVPAIVGGIGVSPDGGHLAYGLRRDGIAYMMVDGNEHGAWESIDSAPVFSPDGKHVVWIGRNEASRIVVNGVESGPSFRGILRGAGITFTSPTQFHVLVLVEDVRFQNQSIAVVARLEGTIKPK